MIQTVHTEFFHHYWFPWFNWTPNFFFIHTCNVCHVAFKMYADDSMFVNTELCQWQFLPIKTYADVAHYLIRIYIDKSVLYITQPLKKSFLPVSFSFLFSLLFLSGNLYFCNRIIPKSRLMHAQIYCKQTIQKQTDCRFRLKTDYEPYHNDIPFIHK